MGGFLVYLSKMLAGIVITILIDIKIAIYNNYYFSQYRHVVAACVLYSMIPDVRVKQDHTRIITIDC